MKHSSKIKQILFAAIVFVITVSVFYVLLFLDIKEKNNNISTLINEVDIILQKEIKLRSVRSLIRDIEEERAGLDSHFVADDEIIDFIETIENIGTDSGAEVEITKVSVDKKSVETADQASISELLNIDFKIEGSFAQVFHFLSMFEKLPFKINMLQINLEKISNKTEKSSKMWSGFFSINVLKLK